MTDPAAIWFPARDLHAWAGNYLVHPQKQLDEIKISICRNGWGSACVAQAGSNRLIIGHGRTAAMLQLLEAGETFDELVHDPDERDQLAQGLIPVRFRSLPDDRAAELAIADNESARMAKRDDSALGRVVAELARDSRTELASRALGMGRAELDRIKRRAGLVTDPRTVKLPEPPKPPAEPDSKVGQVYELGPHRLLCGDSHDDELRTLLLGDQRVAAVVQDPPFAIYGSSTGLSASVTDDAIVRPFFRAMWRNAEASAQLFAHVYVCCDWRSYPSLWDTMKGTHLSPANMLVWDKGAQGLGSKWQNTHELIVFAEVLPEQQTMRGAGMRGSRLVNGRSNVLRHSRPRGDERKHNAAKPRDLIAELIEASTDPRDLVGDFYAGSGTVLLVCAQLDRACRCAEKEAAWCDVIRKRWTVWADAAGVDAGPGALR